MMGLAWTTLCFAFTAIALGIFQYGATGARIQTVGDWFMALLFCTPPGLLVGIATSNWLIRANPFAIPVAARRGWAFLPAASSVSGGAA